MAVPLASPTTQQAPHRAATRRERENRSHCGVARSLFGITKRRRSRLALHPDSPCSHSPDKRQQTLPYAWLLCCCWLALLINPAVAAVPDMRVEGVKMPAWVERGTARLPVAPGMALNNGDGIITGAGARVLLQTADGALIKLGENARMMVSGLGQNQPSHFTAALNVAKGAFRFTAGILAKLRSREVTVKVANATIGIRGTDVWGKAGGNMSTAALEKAIGNHAGSADAQKIDFDVVCLIEGKIEVAYGPGDAFVMDQPQTVYVMPREAAPLPVSPLASEQLGIWAAETEIAAGQGASRSGGKWKVNLLVAANAPDALTHYDELRCGLSGAHSALARRSIPAAHYTTPQPGRGHRAGAGIDRKNGHSCAYS